jgi:hypothetical protein
MRNVATDLKYKKQIDVLRHRLMEELSLTNDPRLIEDGNFFETAPMAGPRKKK